VLPSQRVRRALKEPSAPSQADRMSGLTIGK
jgi:hypothetical protein